MKGKRVYLGVTSKNNKEKSVSLLYWIREKIYDAQGFDNDLGLYKKMELINELIKEYE